MLPECLEFTLQKSLVSENYKVIALSRRKPKIKKKNVIFRKFDIKKNIQNENLKVFLGTRTL